MSHELSLLTYNIHKGFGAGKIRFLLPQMRQAIEAIHPDLVFLQEVQGEHKRRQKKILDWPDASQFEFIAEELWPHYTYGKNAIYTAGHHGNAILSKFEMLHLDNINVATMPRASRSLLHAVINVGVLPQPIHLLCIHLGLFKAERREQVEKLSEVILERVPLSVPLVMAGDFNDWRKDLSAVLEQELGLQEVFKELDGDFAKSYPALRPSFRVDRIYYRGLNLIDGICFKSKPWNLLSDHLPLFAKFEVV